MAGDDDGQRVGPYGPACCLKGAWFSYSLRNVLIGNGLAVGDFCDLRPDLLLKLSAAKFVRQGKSCAPAGKIVLQLGKDFLTKGGRLVFLILLWHNGAPEGHMAIRKARTGRKNIRINQRMSYYFDIEKCKQCPQCGTCYKEGAKSKIYSITIKCDLHKKQQKFQETEYFKEQARKRYMIEAKNNEIKHRHGYDIASSAGIVGMEIQGATTLFVANMKRIVKLMGE